MTIFAQFFAFFGFTFVILQYLQLVRGDAPLVAAISVLPLAAAMMPTARLAPYLVAKAGARTVCAAGLTLVATGLVILAQLDAASPYPLMLAGLLVLGAGMGAAMTPATAAITEALPPQQQGVGSALNDLSREVGGAVGIAVVGSVLASVLPQPPGPVRGRGAGRRPRPRVGRARRAARPADRRPRRDGVRERHAHRAHLRGGRGAGGGDRRRGDAPAGAPPVGGPRRARRAGRLAVVIRLT